MAKSKWKFGLAAMASLAGMAGIASQAKAAAYLSDNFDSYTTGTALVGQGSWTQTGSVATNPMQVTGSTDLSAAVGPTGQDVYKAFTSSVPHVDGGFMDTALTMNVSVLGTTAASSDYFTHLTDVVGGSSIFLERLFVKKSTASTYTLGLNGPGNATTVFGTDVLNTGTAYDIDIKWNFVAGAANDTFDVSINGSPAAGLQGVAWGSASTEPTQIASFNLRQGGGTSSAPTLTVDNINVTASVPEPSSLAGLAVAGVLFSRRKRRA